MNLTGSCAPAVLGVDPHETPLGLFGRMLGGPDPNAAIKAIRRAVEPAMLGLLCAERGLVQSAPPVCENAQVAVKPDGWAGDTLLVVKSCLWLTTSELAESPPWLTAIVQHELMATGADHAAVGVETAGGWFRCGWQSADHEFQAILAEAEQEFLERVAQRQPPTPETAADLDVVKRLWPEDDASEITLGADTLERWQTLQALRKTARDAGERARKIEATIRAAAAGHRILKLPGGVRLSLAVRADSLGRTSRKLVERS